MNKIVKVRQELYDYNNRLYPYIRNWKKNPYTWLKAHLYIEASAMVVYLLLKTTVTPNTVTTIYAIMGIFGGILLAIPSRMTVLLAILVFFFKGILDWSDGPLARLTKQTSIVGDILDPYGSYVGWVSLWVGLGLYVANKSDLIAFYYLVPLIPALWAGDTVLHARNRLLGKYLSINKLQEIIGQGPKKDVGDHKNTQDEKTVSVPKIYQFMHNVVNARARFVDSICLILLIEAFSNIFISWIVFLIFLMWQILVFLARYYWVAKGGEVVDFREKVLEISQEIKPQT